MVAPVRWVDWIILALFVCAICKLGDTQSSCNCRSCRSPSVLPKCHGFCRYCRHIASHILVEDQQPQRRLNELAFSAKTGHNDQSTLAPIRRPEVRQHWTVAPNAPNISIPGNDGLAAWRTFSHANSVSLSEQKTRENSVKALKMMKPKDHITVFPVRRIHCDDNCKSCNEPNLLPVCQSFCRNVCYEAGSDWQPAIDKTDPTNAVTPSPNWLRQTLAQPKKDKKLAVRHQDLTKQTAELGKVVSEHFDRKFPTKSGILIPRVTSKIKIVSPEQQKLQPATIPEQKIYDSDQAAFKLNVEKDAQNFAAQQFTPNEWEQIRHRNIWAPKPLERINRQPVLLIPAVTVFPEQNRNNGLAKQGQDLSYIKRVPQHYQAESSKLLKSWLGIGQGMLQHLINLISNNQTLQNSHEPKLDQDKNLSSKDSKKTSTKPTMTPVSKTQLAESRQPNGGHSITSNTTPRPAPAITLKQQHRSENSMNDSTYSAKDDNTAAQTRELEQTRRPISKTTNTKDSNNGNESYPTSNSGANIARTSVDSAKQKQQDEVTIQTSINVRPLLPRQTIIYHHRPDESYFSNGAVKQRKTFSTVLTTSASLSSEKNKPTEGTNKLVALKRVLDQNSDSEPHIWNSMIKDWVKKTQKMRLNSEADVNEKTQKQGSHNTLLGKHRSPIIMTIGPEKRHRFSENSIPVMSK